MIFVIASLLGSWSLRRSIDNGASMTGIATFRDSGGGRYLYAEEGCLRLADGQTVDAARRYIFEETDGGFAVLFAETPPRLFHRIVLHRVGSSLVGAGTHVCGDDRYDSRYRFQADGSFAVEHAVSGPRKRYALATRYAREPIRRFDEAASVWR